MKTTEANTVVSEQAAQGDVLFRRIAELPVGATKEVPREKGLLIVTHSETGHHHAVEAPDARLIEGKSALIAYLVVDGAYAEVVHHRPYDTHAPLTLPKGIWEVRRQREHTPEGWRRVED